MAKHSWAGAPGTGCVRLGKSPALSGLFSRLHHKAAGKALPIALWPAAFVHTLGKRALVSRCTRPGNGVLVSGRGLRAQDSATAHLSPLGRVMEDGLAAPPWLTSQSGSGLNRASCLSGLAALQASMRAITPAPLLTAASAEMCFP